MRPALVMIALLLAASVASALTYEDISRLWNDPANWHQPKPNITFLKPAPRNLTIIKHGVTLTPKYPIPNWTLRYFTGDCSTCNGLCTPKVKLRPEYGYACLQENRSWHARNITNLTKVNNSG